MNELRFLFSHAEDDSDGLRSVTKAASGDEENGTTQEVAVKGLRV